MAFISRRMTCSSFYVTAFPIGPLLGVLFYSVGGEETDSWENLHLYHEEPVGSFIRWSCRSGKEALGKKASGIRGTRAPERRIVRAFLGWLAFGPSPLGAPGRRIDRAFLGRSAFGPSSIGALMLGRLARGTRPESMVPTDMFWIRKF